MIETREDVESACRAYMIPDYMHKTVEHYLFDKIPGGHFFTAVLTNNLFESVHRADESNANSLRRWVGLIYNEFPGSSWGSPEAVQEWLEDCD